ncbi:head-tail connector protein [Roseivivax marinus]|uniref:head-tail connector protein n=1 Tax=Roseivivax marinus TaxID=1379903 RepID=UPI00273E39A4|nr:head-tail connector protein [Roseivivax marinus]
MILIEETTVPDAALPVDALRQHLRMGTAFEPDAVQATVLASFLRAAISAIEARTAKVLLRRSFALTLEAWHGDEGQPLPVAPVQSLTQVAAIDRFGAATQLEPARFRVTPDVHAPRLVSRSGPLPSVPQGGSVEIRFVAGYAEDMDALPADLFQAVLLLAAHYYEYRDETALGQGCMPFGVTSLIARYRRVRMGFSA